MDKYSLLISIVERGHAEVVMSAARGAGAKGGTILAGRGTGNLHVKKILGAVFEPEKEVVLILAEKNIRPSIMKAIYKEAGLDKEGKGIVFALPVDHVLGSFSIPDFD